MGKFSRINCTNQDEVPSDFGFCCRLSSHKEDPGQCTRRRHPQEDGIMTLAGANVFFQLSPTRVHPILDYVEIVKVFTMVGSGAMWMAQLQILAVTQHNLEVEGSGHLKPVTLLRSGQACAHIKSAMTPIIVAI